MARTPNRFGGGARTNANGLHFEQTTALDTALTDAGYRVSEHKVYDGNTYIGLSVQKGSYKNVPSHKDISADLEERKKENPEMYKKFYDLLKKVFDCHDVTEEEYASISFDSGFSAEHILKVIKWLFIEQDIAYWSYSGRNMTWGLVPDAY